MAPLDDLLDFQAMEQPVSLDVDAIVSRGRARRRHRLAIGGAVVAVLVIVAGVVIARPSPARRQAVATAVAAPCDSPSRTVPRYLDWPCASTTVPAAYAAQLKKLVVQARNADFYADPSTTYPTAPHNRVQMRLLAFGPQPESMPGTTLMVMEYWRTTGSTPAQVEVLHTAADGNASTDRDEVPVAGDPAMFSIAANIDRIKPDTFAFAYPRLTACQQLTLHPPQPPNNAVSCGRTVIARQDVAEVRLVRGPGRVDPSDPVHDRIGAVAEAFRETNALRSWRIEAFDSSGAPLGAVPYIDSVEPSGGLYY